MGRNRRAWVQATTEDGCESVACCKCSFGYGWSMSICLLSVNTDNSSSNGNSGSCMSSIGLIVVPNISTLSSAVPAAAPIGAATGFRASHQITNYCNLMINEYVGVVIVYDIAVHRLSWRSRLKRHQTPVVSEGADILGCCGGWPNWSLFQSVCLWNYGFLFAFPVSTCSLACGSWDCLSISVLRLQKAGAYF